MSNIPKVAIQDKPATAKNTAPGIKKLSDLKGDKLQAFGARLRVMGAKL